MDAQLNKARTLDAVNALNRGDLDGYLAIYAPGAVVHGLPDHVSPGVDGHREVLTEIMARPDEPWAWGLLLELFDDPDATWTTTG